MHVNNKYDKYKMINDNSVFYGLCSERRASSLVFNIFNTMITITHYLMLTIL